MAVVSTKYQRKIAQYGIEGNELQGRRESALDMSSVVNDISTQLSQRKIIKNFKITPVHSEALHELTSGRE